MRNNNESKNNKHIYTRITIGTITFLLIAALLSGKIIDIPHGTNQGGIICGIGVLIIMIIMFAVSVGVNKLIIQKNIHSNN